MSSTKRSHRDQDPGQTKRQKRDFSEIVRQATGNIGSHCTFSSAHTAVVTVLKEANSEKNVTNPRERLLDFLLIFSAMLPLGLPATTMNLIAYLAAPLPEQILDTKGARITHYTDGTITTEGRGNYGGRIYKSVQSYLNICPWVKKIVIHPGGALLLLENGRLCFLGMCAIRSFMYKDTTSASDNMYNHHANHPRPNAGARQWEDTESPFKKRVYFDIYKSSTDNGEWEFHAIGHGTLRSPQGRNEGESFTISWTTRFYGML